MSLTPENKVEVDLEEVDTDDLIKELESRGHDVDTEASLSEFSEDELVMELESRGNDAGCVDMDDINTLFDLFYQGRTNDAMELAKKIAQDHTGRILV